MKRENQQIMSVDVNSGVSCIARNDGHINESKYIRFTKEGFQKLSLWLNIESSYDSLMIINIKYIFH